MARISQKELEAATFRGQKIEKRVADLSKPSDIVYYTIYGKHTELDEEDYPIVLKEEDAYAKQVRRGSTYTYYVMVGNSGHLHDPNGLYSTREETRRTQLRGRPELRLMKTKKLVFDHYIKFLATKNKFWLKWAEREM